LLETISAWILIAIKSQKVTIISATLVLYALTIGDSMPVTETCHHFPKQTSRFLSVN